MTLGDRIADLRKERGLTQEALGEQLGVSRQAVSKWESDTATPDIEKLIGLSKAFDVTIGFLLGVEETTCEAQAAESASGEKRSEAEVLEHYLNELPKPRTLSKSAKLGIAALAAIAVFGVFGYVSYTRAQMNQMNDQLVAVNGRLSVVQGEMDRLGEQVYQQVSEAMERDYGVLASEDCKIVSTDFANGQVTVGLNAVLRERLEKADGLRFYAICSDGSEVVGEIVTFDADTSRLTAQVTVPIQDNLKYFLTTPSATVQVVEKYDFESVGALASKFELSFSGDLHWSTEGDLIVLLPQCRMEYAADGNADNQPEAQIWAELNGKKITSDIPLLLAVDNDIDTAYAPGNVSYGERLVRMFEMERIELSRSELFQSHPNEGDVFTVGYRVTMPDGRSASGKLEEGLMYIGNGQWSMHDE